MFEFTNEQRAYFGLENLQPRYARIILKGDKYRPDSFLYYDHNKIVRHIISTEDEYKEYQYDQETENREYLLPKTGKGKKKKISASAFEKGSAAGIYCSINRKTGISIGNLSTGTIFYDSEYDDINSKNEGSIENLVARFIDTCPPDYFASLTEFKLKKRKNIRYKTGDFFRFRLNRELYGFGRILLDINKLRKLKIIPENHGLNYLMGAALLVKIYAFRSGNKEVDLGQLKTMPALPSDYIMDNKIFYGEYEIIGHAKLAADELDFPISYGRDISYATPAKVFLQWGLIHLELPMQKFSQYLENRDRPNDQNPFGYYSIGFEPAFGKRDLDCFIQGQNAYATNQHYKSDRDLRNPKNLAVKNEIFQGFQLDSQKSYIENAKEQNAPDYFEIIELLK